MDRRTILAVVLSLGIYYSWLLWRGPKKPPPEAVAGPTSEAPADPAGEAPADPVPAAGAAPALPVETRTITLCGERATVSSDGAGIGEVVLPDVAGPYRVTPIYEWLLGKVTGSHPGPWKPYGDDPGPAHLLGASARALIVGVGDGPASGAVRARLVEAADGRVVFEGRAPEGLDLRQEIREVADGDLCTLAVTTTWTRSGGDAFTGQVWTAVLDHTSGRGGRNDSQHQPMALVDGSLHYGGALGAGCVRAGTQLTDTSGPIPLPGDVSWYGVSDRYFGFFVVPDADGDLRFERVGSGPDAIDGAVFGTPITVPAGSSVTHTAKVYAGANHLSVLGRVHDDLRRVVDLGWFALFGQPLLWLLRWLHGLLGDWGLSIVALTVMVKILFFPMTHNAMKSGQKMQAIQPELKRLREQFAEDPQELNRRTMELMSREGANPLTGCLPLLVQTPVFIALYNVLLTNVEFYQQEFLWLRDLSSPDPYCVLPVTVTLLMWGQQQLTPTPPEMDPAQASMLKWMPLLFGLFFFTSPSGLGVYFFVNMSLSILQQWLIKRSLGVGSKAPPPVGANP